MMVCNVIARSYRVSWQREWRALQIQGLAAHICIVKKYTFRLYIFRQLLVNGCVPPISSHTCRLAAETLAWETFVRSIFIRNQLINTGVMRNFSPALIMHSMLEARHVRRNALMMHRELRRWCDTLDAKHAVLHSRREQRAGRFASALRALKKVLLPLLSYACFGIWRALLVHVNARALLASSLCYKSPSGDRVLVGCPVRMSSAFILWPESKHGSKKLVCPLKFRDGILLSSSVRIRKVLP